ncbi:Uu.00g044660.m01.CDS01 [Anthostomella pinea]|uniref:Uu.00g044660.m01.CDS01 n=1 Tax=Anthostomella pinea TaxID=933095 RepID=A0AAI8VB42_9PEZI|nr:Uu.00g044660.m01.CDS01 [Anthostomella pinea]
MQESNQALPIVLSDKYHDLDKDRGDIIYYSGPNSRTNEDPDKHKPSTSGTKPLKASLDEFKALYPADIRLPLSMTAERI